MHWPCSAIDARARSRQSGLLRFDDGPPAVDRRLRHRRDNSIDPPRHAERRPTSHIGPHLTLGTAELLAPPINGPSAERSKCGLPAGSASLSSRPVSPSTSYPASSHGPFAATCPTWSTPSLAAAEAATPAADRRATADGYLVGNTPRRPNVCAHPAADRQWPVCRRVSQRRGVGMVRCRGFARSKHLNSAGAFVGGGLSRHRGPGRRPHSTPLGVVRGIGRSVHGPRRCAGRPPAGSAAPLHWATAVSSIFRRR